MRENNHRIKQKVKKKTYRIREGTNPPEKKQSPLPDYIQIHIDNKHGFNNWQTPTHAFHIQQYISLECWFQC